MNKRNWKESRKTNQKKAEIKYHIKNEEWQISKQPKETMAEYSEYNKTLLITQSTTSEEYQAEIRKRQETKELILYIKKEKLAKKRIVF